MVATMTREHSADLSFAVDRAKAYAIELTIEWIRTIQDKHDISSSALAARAGLAASTITRMTNQPDYQFMPTLKTLRAIAAAMREPIPDQVLHAHGISPKMVSPPPAKGKEFSIEAIMPNGTTIERSEPSSKHPAVKKIDGMMMLSVRAVSSLPKTLQPRMTSEVRVPCPPQLESDPSAFAFYQPDNSLMPVFRAGTLMYATKRRDPIVGDFVLVTDGQGRSKVRLVKDIVSDGLLLDAAAGPFSDEEMMSYDEIESLAIVAGEWRI